MVLNNLSTPRRTQQLTTKTMPLNVSLCVLFFSVLVLMVASPKPPNCRCQPHEACWPSPDKWSALNNTIQGTLIPVRPAAAPCHDPTFNEQECAAIQSNWTNSFWRAAEPGAVQWENWEAWPEHGNQSCYAESPRDVPCKQGRISLYSARAQNASQIQEVVRFAQVHDLRLVVKNSGHDFLGRSSAPGSLQILTQGMKDIRLVDDFVPKGAVSARGNGGEGHAVTIAAGVNLAELYAAVARHNRTVIGGSSRTVGAAGGYIHGGGHSPFSTWKGLASDNALEFEVVTANGNLVTANAYQNTDLFWALRGGGGGTFGITTSVTIRSFPEVPVVISKLNITTAHGDPHFWDGFTQFHAALPALNDAGGSGYYATRPNLSLNQTSSVAAFTATLLFPENTDTTAIDRLHGPLLDKLRQIPSAQIQYASFAMPSMNKVISKALLGGVAAKFDTTGSNNILGSRLFSKDLLESKDGPERLTNAWKRIKTPPSSQFIGFVVAGGAVASNADEIDSAVHPAWRKTVIHMGFTRSWDANASIAEQHSIIRNMTNVEIPILRGVEGEENMGAYVNEASPYEPGFQKSFWGDNYEKLYAVKKRWDPKGLFITRMGVGSEDWDDAGVCSRVSEWKIPGLVPSSLL